MLFKVGLRCSLVMVNFLFLFLVLLFWCLAVSCGCCGAPLWGFAFSSGLEIRVVC